MIDQIPRSSPPYVIGGFALGVILVTIYRAASYRNGTGGPFGVYFKEKSAEVVTHAILAVILMFLWTEEYLQVGANALADLIVRDETAQGFPDLKTNFTTSIAAGAFLGYFGVRLIIFVGKYLPGQKGKLPE